jgi:hypothetical protein
LRTKNEIREKPKIGFEVGDKVKSEFIENETKKLYSEEVIKVNPATYKVKFSDGAVLNMKKAEVFADEDSVRAVTTPDNQPKIQEVEPEAKTKPQTKPKVLTVTNIKENDRVSVYWPKDKQSYDATVRKIKKGGWYELAYDDGEVHNELFNKKT